MFKTAFHHNPLESLFKTVSIKVTLYQMGTELKITLDQLTTRHFAESEKVFVTLIKMKDWSENLAQIKNSYQLYSSFWRGEGVLVLIQWISVLALG